jgi:hypothetical protein
MCLPTRAHNIRNLDSSLGARRHVRGALTTLFKLKRVVQREEKGQSGLIKGFYPQQTSLNAASVISKYTHAHTRNITAHMEFIVILRYAYILSKQYLACSEY